MITSLDVYRVALDFLTLTDEVNEHLPRGRSHLADQLNSASTSLCSISPKIVASSLGQTSAGIISAPVGQRPSPQPYLTFAYGSSLSTRCQRETGKAMLEGIVSMLIELAQRLDVD